MLKTLMEKIPNTLMAFSFDIEYPFKVTETSIFYYAEMCIKLVHEEFQICNLAILSVFLMLLLHVVSYI